MVGMKKEAQLMNTAQVATVRAHVAAVSKLLLGTKTMKPSLAIFAGEELDPIKRLELAQAVADGGVDLIHLGFAVDPTGEAVMTDITVFLPRDTLCYSWRECRLSLPAGQTRAVIMGPEGMPSHFRILPGEIVQVNGTPKALERGVDRAAQRLAALVRDGVDLTGQVVLDDTIPA